MPDPDYGAGTPKDPFPQYQQEGQDTFVAPEAVEVTGARDEPEGALASLLTALETLGLITDSTTAS